MTLSAGTRVRVSDRRSPFFGKVGTVLQGAGPYRVRVDGGGAVWLPGASVEAV